MIVLTIPGPLRGKGRPRFGNGRAYTPKATVLAQLRIQAAARWHRVPMLDGFVRVHVVAAAGVPKSWNKAKAAAALAAGYDARKPDGDNVLKLVMDALNGIAWRDDVQVVDARVERRIMRTGPKLIIHIDQLTEAAE